MSLPTRERGLKSSKNQTKVLSGNVAPYTGAWIEIFSEVFTYKFGRSLPTRERGLKYVYEVKKDRETPSLPTRERGLKSILNFKIPYIR